MPSVNVVNGKQIVVENLGSGARMVRFFAKPFLQMWHHRDLIQAILRREVAERFKGSIAGWVWAVVAPLLAIAVYTFFFAGRLDLPKEYIITTGQNTSYALFILSGIVVFNFWSEMAFRAPMLLHEYVHFIKQTIFPSDMLAVISTLRATLYTVISIVVLMVFQFLVVGSLPWTWLLLPFIFIPFLAFLVGMSWFLCAVGAFTRDAGYLMINIVPLFMFATPVFYARTQLPVPLDFWLYANALTGYVEVMRDIMLVGQFPNWQVYAWTLFTSIFTFYFGYWFFDRYRNVIVDVL
ncbi:MAG: ABC transporter permease [Reyranella sp.]|uniref:ABC transporter permease n=1 Tax=Reyranella sp. TaxID=1929291 RepID=UPI001AC1D272|nr:ABC transporter permease [Reyranella sp.]MBN9089013.1 ABC transporter permease [Reyranella sp.]